MKSELTQPAGAHNNWREMYTCLIIQAACAKSLLLYYCLGPGILIRFFITGVSAYCS